MAVAVYISNEQGSTEIAVDTKSTQEIALVGRSFPGAVPVRIVSRTIPGVKIKRIANIKHITQGEVL